MSNETYDVVVVGGGHAGAEAAAAACRVLSSGLVSSGRVCLLTMDVSTIGVMSCNPSIGGLAKGQVVREVDALGGIMGRVADETGIQFRMLNSSKGPAVQGPRCQSDKYAYAEAVQRELKALPLLDIRQGLVEDFVVRDGRCVGVNVRLALSVGDDPRDHETWQPSQIEAGAVVLTTGTFMRAMMHTGERQTRGGRVDEASAESLSVAMMRVGFELQRLKTGTPPRLDSRTIDWSQLEEQPGDVCPQPFSDSTDRKSFPQLSQIVCHTAHTCPEAHELIRANLDRAPMYNGQIDSKGPRYCPSIEDKVMRFADKDGHPLYFEPEGLDTNEVYVNGISTSLPADVQEAIVALLPGCADAKILRHGYAVEYDAVQGHQLDATCQSKLLTGLFTAGQLNGTSGYEEAAGQGLIAGLNAVRLVKGLPLVRLGRDQAYIGVMLDDLTTKYHQEPYRLFTSRAEWRLSLRSDNAADRLTRQAREWGLIADAQWQAFEERSQLCDRLRGLFKNMRLDVPGKRGVRRVTLREWALRPEVSLSDVATQLESQGHADLALHTDCVAAVWAENLYEGYLVRQSQEVARMRENESCEIPADIDYLALPGLRKEAALKLKHFQPATLGQAGRLEGVNPSDVMILSVYLSRQGEA